MASKKMPKMPKNAELFSCEMCNFNCSKLSNYKQHIMTRKHKMIVNASENDSKMIVKNANMEFTCECGKKYKYDSGYYRHKKACFFTQKMPEKPNLSADDNASEISDTDISATQTTENDSHQIIKDLIQDNREMRNMMVDMMKSNMGNHNVNNTNHTNSHNSMNNSHNKTFNLQFFLNETCKDALNITDFVNSLKLTLRDLENVGELGYAEGISRAFVKGLNDLDVTKRPIHCSDAKREVLHIKNNNMWEGDDNKDKLTMAIKNLSTRNLMLMDDWQKENPGCKEYNNRKNGMYLKMMVESCGPADESAEKRDFGKIIKSIAKTTVIDRANIQQ